VDIDLATKGLVQVIEIKGFGLEVQSLDLGLGS